MRRLAIPITVAVLAVAALGTAHTDLAPRASALPPDAWPDFDDDGFTDLAIGMPEATAQGSAAAGVVIVLYGTASGLTSTGSQVWNADTVLETGSDLQAGARFGFSVAGGDFDYDGYGDLAIGAPYFDSDVESEGKVWVLFGSPQGLTASGSQIWEPLGPDLEDARAGFALVALDWFDLDGPNDKGDAYADLAIGAPTWGSPGKVWIVAGQRFAQLPGGHTVSFTGSSSGEWFGAALERGDFNDTLPGPGAGLDDLAVGTPFRKVSGQLSAGGVTIIQRGSNGLAQKHHFHQNTAGFAGTAEAGDVFGSSLASGDVTGDGYDDLAVGVPSEDIGSAVNAGLVQLIPSDPDGSGLQPQGTLIAHGAGAMSGSPGANASFGSSLAMARLDTGLTTDLVIGERGREVAGHVQAGAVAVIYGGDGGLDLSTGEIWSQASVGIDDGPEQNDFFGSALTVGRFGGTYHWDLIVGAKREDVVPSVGEAPVHDAGVLHLIRGGSGGLTGANSELWSVHSPGVPRILQAGDEFGGVLSR